MQQNQILRCLWLAGIWLMASCMAPEDKRPNDLIDENRMVDILTEIQVIEARTSRLNLASTDSAYIAYKHQENQIFRKLKVDTAAYRKSYIFYSAHPADMEAIYKQVSDRLTKRLNQKRKPHP